MKEPDSLPLPQKESGFQLERSRVATAEESVRVAKEESRAAKRKRKEAKKIARCAKKRLRCAKDDLAAARRALAKAEEKAARQALRAASQRKRLVAIVRSRAPSKRKVARDATAVAVNNGPPGNATFPPASTTPETMQETDTDSGTAHKKDRPFNPW